MPAYKIWNANKHVHLSKEHTEFDYEDGKNWRLWANAEESGFVSSMVYISPRDSITIDTITDLVVNEWDGEPIVSPPLYDAVVIDIGMYGDVESAHKDGAFHQIPDNFEGTESNRCVIRSVVDGMATCVGHSPKDYWVFWFDGRDRYTKDLYINKDTVWIDLVNPYEGTE